MVSIGLARAICFTASALSSSGILTFFLITLIIFCPLSLDKVLNLVALLKVMDLCPVDLAIGAITFPGFLGGSGFPAGWASSNFLAGGLSLGLLAGTGCS